MQLVTWSLRVRKRSKQGPEALVWAGHFRFLPLHQI
jgi:hypothetical protein